MKPFGYLRLLLGVLYLAWVEPASADAPAGGLATHIVSRYALTSANDFPQRDPMNWRLLGSNDNGTNWMVLDVRTNEVFLERHQRRLFQASNTRPYHLYRLEIDRVREPASANSVHLAEIEPLGPGTDEFGALPGFGDSITARGDNAPLEAGSLAFDGHPETKWLDFAADAPDTRSSWIQWQYGQPSGAVISSIKQLLAMRARAAERYFVKFEGVVANPNVGTHRIGILDETGYLEVVWDKGQSYNPGQRLLLTGTSQWTNNHVDLALGELAPLGPSAPAAPRTIALAQRLPAEEEFHWVEMEGVAGFLTRSAEHVAFELAEGDRRVTVQVLQIESHDLPPVVGRRVRVRGICSGARNARGDRVVSLLWAPTVESIVPIASPANEANRGAAMEQRASSHQPPATLRQLRQLSPAELTLHPVIHVRGIVTEVFGSYIQDETAGIELWGMTGRVANKYTPKLSDCVDVEGTGDWVEGHGPVLRAGKLEYVGKGVLPWPAEPTWEELASGQYLDQWIEVQAVVRSTDGSHLLLIGEGGKMMATVRSGFAPSVRALVDATVRLRGLNIKATDDRGQIQGLQLLVPSLEFVEVLNSPGDPFALPTRPIGSLFGMGGLRELTHRVKIAGVLTLSQEGRFFLQDSTGSAMAIGREDIVLDSPPGAYHWAFFQTQMGKGKGGGKAAELEGFKPGDRLEVVGFPESREGYSPVLTEVLARRVGTDPLVKPVEATVNEIGLGKLDSTLLSLDAVLFGQEFFGDRWVFEFRSEQTPFQVVMPSVSGRRAQYDAGTRMRITGVCQIDPSPFPELGRRIASFKILAESPAEAFTVLERPPWWTLKRAMAIGGVLVVILAVAAAWIGILRRHVEMRTAMLQEEIAQHERTERELGDKKALLEKEIEERKRMEIEVDAIHKKLFRASRLAGMAEVATNVLHNVGNVLNNTNMLASSITEQLRRSKVGTLVKAADLVKEHRSDLAHFLTTDQRGQHVPGLLEELAIHLAEDRKLLQSRMEALTDSVQHIHEAVAMQQKYAKVSSPKESVLLADIIEDALRICVGSLERQNVRVRRDYESLPVFAVDRHKVLQILFNLLENALQACVEGREMDRTVTLRLRLPSAGRVQIQVLDNGIGIASDHLSQIFSQGFSTRATGHGFGLHSSVLAAQEMGGALNVQSDGPGKGACFTLEIPVSSENG